MFKLGIYMTACLLFEVHFPSLNYAIRESNEKLCMQVYPNMNFQFSLF